MRRAAPLLALVLAGCGSPSADLFDVKRTGTGKNSTVRLVVADSGLARCNDGEETNVGADRLLKARELARDLEELATFGIELAPQKNSTLRYEVSLEEGTVKFSDTSKDRPPEFDRVVAFTTDVVENVCGLER